MKKGQKLWTRDELLLAINLYCKLRYGQLHNRNPEIQALAKLLGRTVNSVGFKLNNFASLDPSLKARGITGAANSSKLDREVWAEYYENWDDRFYEGEKLRAENEKTTLEKKYEIDENSLPTEGKEREMIVKGRVNQTSFRRIVMAAYNETCCITGLQNAELLVAGHISPWNSDEKNRMNPRNGLAMNSLHDKAFENGLLTVTPDYKIRISSFLKKKAAAPVQDLFLRYEGREIFLPDRFLPDSEFLKYHNEVRFRK